MRIGLLQLIGRSMDQELASLLEVRFPFDEYRERLLARRRRDHPEDLGHLPRPNLPAPDRVAEPSLEDALDLVPGRQDPRVPFEVVVDAGEASIMQLVG